MDGGVILKTGAKTYTGNREIPFSTFLVPSLNEQIKNYYTDNQYKLIFTNIGKIINPSSVNTVLKRIDRQLGLPTTITNHALRHTFGTRCIESGMSAVVVQRLMGHKAISITINTYTSVLAKFKNKELNKVAQYYIYNDFIALPSESIIVTANNYTFDEEIASKFMYHYGDVVQQQYEIAVKKHPIIQEKTN